METQKFSVDSNPIDRRIFCRPMARRVCSTAAQRNAAASSADEVPARRVDQNHSFRRSIRSPSPYRRSSGSRFCGAAVPDGCWAPVGTRPAASHRMKIEAGRKANLAGARVSMGAGLSWSAGQGSYTPRKIGAHERAQGSHVLPPPVHLGSVQSTGFCPAPPPQQYRLGRLPPCSPLQSAGQDRQSSPAEI